MTPIGELAVNEMGRYDEVLRITDASRGADQVFTRRANWKKIQYEAEDFVVYRPMFFEDKKARNKEQLERVARRELSRRMKDTLTYNCTLRGHRPGVTYCPWGPRRPCRGSPAV